MMNKLSKGLDRHFPKKDAQMASEDMERCSTSLTSRGVQIRTAMRYQLTPVRMAISKKKKKKLGLPWWPSG